MLYFVTNSIGLMTSWPLILVNLQIFRTCTAEWTSMRLPYYLDIATKVLPSLVYLASKTNEDCFNCFNRLAPHRYSILQYSKEEKKKQKYGILAASEEKDYVNNKHNQLSYDSLGDSKRMMILVNGTEVDLSSRRYTEGVLLGSNALLDKIVQDNSELVSESSFSEQSSFLSSRESYTNLMFLKSEDDAVRHLSLTETEYDKKRLIRDSIIPNQLLLSLPPDDR